MGRVAKDIDAWRDEAEKTRRNNEKVYREYEKSRGRNNNGGGDKGPQDKGGIDTKPAKDALDRAKKKRF